MVKYPLIKSAMRVNTIEKLVELTRRAIIAILAFTMFCGVQEGQASSSKGALSPFEHVGLNIFVPVTITGADGRSVMVNFIVDSGTNRTTVDLSVAKMLDLAPYQVSRNTTPSGTALRYTAQTRQLCSLSQCTEGLEVLFDDLSLYSAGYGRPASGLLATDFLEKWIVLIDFPNSRIGFLPAHADLKGFADFKTTS
jgi:hypothetical protein